MSRERHQQANAIFLAACDLEAAAIPAFVRERCGEDAALAQQVYALLAADAQDDGFLEAAQGTLPALGEDSVIGERRYRLRKRLGAGGMGEVWLAERADGEFRQRVAIKLIQASQRLSREALRRFRAERQILAAFNHPNIARLLDGGTLADGAPFLVMEYVDGVAIDTWCERAGLDARSRVALFLKVSDAVAAAHAALIVHRDLKPSNILVGADGEPKLLDFGIAKVLKAELFAHSLAHTRTGVAPMTLAYASPEQVRGEVVGTASDVYALGVVLYELLTGVLPYRASLSDPVSMARAVCEESPEAPSRSTQRAGVPTARSGQHSQLRGDLDAILLKALRKEPGERYRSVEHFAADLRRWLDGLPVLARRGSRAYAARKFVARNRFAVAAALLFLALVLGFAFDRQRQLLVVQQQRDRAEQALALLREVLSSADPTVARDEDLSARQILESGARKLAGDASIAPDLRFDLLLALTEIEQVLGLGTQVQAHIETLAPLAASLPPPAGERLDLVRLQGLNSKRDSAAADPLGDALVGPILAGRSALSASEQGKVLIARANTLDQMSRGDEAEPLLRTALILLPADGPEAPVLRASANGQLGQVLQNVGRLTEAEVFLRETLAISLRHAFDDFRISRYQNNLAGVLAMQGRFGESLALHEDGIARFVHVVGTDHPEYAIRLNNLGSTEIGAGRIDAALGHLRSALELARERYGADSVVYAVLLVNLAAGETAAGDFAGAQAHSDAAHAILLPKFGVANLQSIRALRGAGVLALERGEMEAARGRFEECVEGAGKAGLLANPGVTRCQLGLAELRLYDDDLVASGRLLDTLEAAQAKLDPRHFERGMAALVRAAWLLRKAQPAQARQQLAAIRPEALNEPWQAAWRDLLAAAADNHCAQAAAARSVLAQRWPQGHPRWQSLCALP